MAEKRIVDLIDTETHEVKRYEVALLDDELPMDAAVRVLEIEEDFQKKDFLIVNVERA